MRIRLVAMLVGALFVSTTTGCQFVHRAQADPVEFTLGREFSLGGGQEAALQGDSLRLRFTDVLEDSRCPTDVECFWTGQARITLEPYTAEQRLASIVFNTNPAPGQNSQRARVGDYLVSLKSLDPYPRQPDHPISFEDYRATLLVQR